MSFSFPDSYLALAETLSRNEDEASYRTSVSRAYYAVFHAGKELCLRRGFDLTGRTTHQAVWMHFKQAPGNRRDLLPLYTKAKFLQEAREQSDYESKPIEPVDWRQQSQASLEQCRKFLEAIAKLA